MSSTPANAPLSLTQRKDDLGYQALITRFWSVTIVCEWCGEPFHHTMKAGQKPKYCSQACRTESRRAYSRYGVRHE